MGKRKRDSAPKLTSDQIGAARALAVDVRTLRRWQKDPSFPDCSDGFAIEPIKAWRDERQLGGSKEWHDAQTLQLALKSEKLKQEEIRTQRARLDLAEREGQLIDRTTVELALATILKKHGDWCHQLPDILRGKCCSKCRERVPPSLKQELDQRRNDLANELSSLRSS